VTLYSKNTQNGRHTLISTTL